MSNNIPEIDPSLLNWQDATVDKSHPGHKLIAQISLGSYPLYFEAHEVKKIDGQQQFVADADNLETIYSAFGCEGPWDVAVINSRSYVILALPGSNNFTCQLN